MCIRDRYIGVNLSAEVLAHQPMVEKYARQNGIKMCIRDRCVTADRELYINRAGGEERRLRLELVPRPLTLYIM